MKRITSKITLPVKILNGKFASNTNTIDKILDAHEGHIIDITFSRRRNKRSNPQNKFYWGVVVMMFIEAIYDQWGEIKSKEEVHEFLKHNCNYEEKVNEATGEILRVPKGASENDTKQESLYHQKCRQLGLEFFNINIPKPMKDGENIEMDF